ncbi:MAG: asparagine synthase-related protein, partial [Colwellia sp.]|nr:asparagine synthase-related protein [Colwellia sp.]
MNNQKNNNMQYNSRIQTASAAVIADITTNKPHSFYQGELCTVVLCGDIFLQEEMASPEEISHFFINNQKCINTLYQKLSGQFWLVVFDNDSNKLFLVNDHFGMQPCFYTQQSNSITISDSLKKLKSISEISLSISEQAIFNYMYFHCIPSPNTIFEQVSKLEPGKAVIFEQQKTDSAFTATEQLLYCPSFNQKKAQTVGSHQACLDVIEKAVTKHASSDCGAFLSGGLDSSSVAGMLARSKSPAKTFSIGFDIEGYDETPYAQLTAKHFGTQHEVLFLQPEQAAEEFVKVAQYFDEPFGNSSAMATYFCAKFAKSHGVSRLLAGDGGDELFAGNDRYAKQKQFEFYQQVPSAIRGITKGMFCHTPIGKLPLLSKGASYIQQAEVPLPDRLESYNFLNRLGVNNMFNQDFLSTIDTQQPIMQQRQRYQDCSSEHIVDQMLYLDWKFTLADNDLVKVGRMCDMAGVDVRYPLLDKSVVD